MPRWQPIFATSSPNKWPRETLFDLILSRSANQPIRFFADRRTHTDAASLMFLHSAVTIAAWDVM
jgi:hypothetical protein